MSKLTKGYGSTSIQQILTYLKTYLAGKFALKTNIPTKVSDLTNDSGFITKIVDDLVNYYLKSEIYSKAEIDALIGAISSIHLEYVQTLPTQDIQTNVIYLVPSSDPQASNIKDEYINLDGTTAGWEKIGSTDIDLSGYVTITQLNTVLADYVTSSNLTTILADYATTTSVTSALEMKAALYALRDVVDTLGSKNMLNIVTESDVYVKGGITYTINRNEAGFCESIRVQGNASAQGYDQKASIVQLGTFEMPKDAVRYSGHYISGSLCAFGTEDESTPTGIWLILQKDSPYDGTGSDSDYKRLKINTFGSSGVLRTDEDYGTYYVSMWVQASSGEIDTLVYPMVSGSHLLNNAPYFRPYAPTNREIGKILRGGWTLLKSVDITTTDTYNLLEIGPNDHTTYVDKDFLIVIYPVIIGPTSGVDFSSDDFYVESKSFECNSMHHAFELCSTKTTDLFSHTNEKSNTVDTIYTYFGVGDVQTPARMLRCQFPARGKFTTKYKFIVEIYIK